VIAGLPPSRRSPAQWPLPGKLVGVPTVVVGPRRLFKGRVIGGVVVGTKLVVDVVVVGRGAAEVVPVVDAVEGSVVDG
jgi:hypothetical protein